MDKYMSKSMRLDKFLAEHTEFSRSSIKAELKKGIVTVNGTVVTVPETKIDPEADTITFKDEVLSYREFSYFMLHKPAGVVSATEDTRDKTVLSLLPPHLRKDIFPVGRLDKDTEGLLLLTDDGALAHDLLSPKKHVDKTYFVRLKHPASEADVLRFSEGLDIGEDKPTLPAVLAPLNGDECLVTIREGKFHQIKRMFHACNNEVLYLKRLSMGPLKLDNALQPGEYRVLTEEEITALQNVNQAQRPVSS